jgi:hypothetical protein
MLNHPTVDRLRDLGLVGMMLMRWTERVWETSCAAMDV